MGFSQNDTWLRQFRRNGDGVVHQDIEAALLALDLLEQRGDLLVVGVVDLHRNALAAATRRLPRRFRRPCRAADDEPASPFVR